MDTHGAHSIPYLDDDDPVRLVPEWSQATATTLDDTLTAHEQQLADAIAAQDDAIAAEVTGWQQLATTLDDRTQLPDPVSDVPSTNTVQLPFRTTWGPVPDLSATIELPRPALVDLRMRGAVGAGTTNFHMLGFKVSGPSTAQWTAMNDVALWQAESYRQIELHKAVSLTAGEWTVSLIYSMSSGVTSDATLRYARLDVVPLRATTS